MKIVVIGAGSAMFTQGLVVDLTQAADLGPWELGLVDIDPAALEAAEGLSRKIVAASGAALTIRAATDRRELLRDADVVVRNVDFITPDFPDPTVWRHNSIAVGTYQRRSASWF